MDSIGKIAGGRTPSRNKDSPIIKEISSPPIVGRYFDRTDVSENTNPNKVCTNPSPSSKFVKSQKSASKIADYGAEQPKFKNRKFIFTKKTKKKNTQKVNHMEEEEEKGVPLVSCEHEFLTKAYENLRISQEKFFNGVHCGRGEEGNSEEHEELKVEEDDKHEEKGEEGVGSSGKRRREKLMEETMECGLGSGSEKVKYLVTEFERLLMENHEGKEEIGEREAMGVRDSLDSLCPSELVLTSESLGLNLQLSSSWEYRIGGCSRGLIFARRKGRNMCQSLVGDGEKKINRRKRQQGRVTNQKPFNLITEVRGRMKEEQFETKIRQMEEEDERWRIPLAHGLPWTTDEQESLIKPPVKERTVPLDIRLHSDIRAVERSDFDHQVEQKMVFIQQYKMNKMRLEKIEEEEEIKRLRKELIPKAHPLPYFDRPFVPKRSEKNRTVPREPKFQLPQHKKLRCICSSWGADVSIPKNDQKAPIPL